jgi:hypothetical protein
MVFMVTLNNRTALEAEQRIPSLDEDDTDSDQATEPLTSGATEPTSPPRKRLRRRNKNKNKNKNKNNYPISSLTSALPFSVSSSSIQREQMIRRELLALRSLSAKVSITDRVPRNYAEAMSPEFRERYEPAIKEELASLGLNNVFGAPVPLPQGASPLGLRWIFDVKRDSEGRLSR